MPTLPDSRTHLRASVAWRRDLSEDLWILRLAPEEPFDYRPGQFATLRLPEGDGLIERPYSIVSSPLEGDLEFFIELVPDGRLTPPLYRLSAGDVVYIRRTARGNLRLERGVGRRRCVLVSTVTGVAPFVSMVRTLSLDPEVAAAGPGREILLMQGASRSWELGYQEELTALERAADWFHYVPTVSRPWEDTAWRGERGRVHERLAPLLDRFRLDPSSAEACLCGNPLMIESARQILIEKGFGKDSIQEERYWPLRES